MARQSSIRKVLTIRYVSTLIFHYLKSNSPLSKKEGNWGKNMSRNGFRDCYWGRVGQLLVNFFPSLVTVPEIFTIVNSSSPVSDQCQYSPNSVNRESRGKAMGITEIIT